MTFGSALQKLVHSSWNKGSRVLVDKWLVTGSAGFLGVNAGYWLRGRVKTIGNVRGPCSSQFFDEQIPFDLRDLRLLEKNIRSLRPKVILNTAAVSGHETCANDPHQARSVNVDAVRVMSEVSAELGIRLIHISTDAVFSGAIGNYTESDQPEPFSIYGETKLAGELEIIKSGVQALIVRTNFYGWSPSNRRSILEFFVSTLRENQNVRGYPDFVVTSMYVQSLIEALWQLNSGGLTGIIHIASSDALSKYGFGLTVAAEFGLQGSLIEPILSTEAGLSTSRSRNLSLNTDLFQGLTEHRVETQIEGIHRARIEELTVGVAIRSSA